MMRIDSFAKLVQALDQDLACLVKAEPVPSAAMVE
jgi:hypothetical protein